MSVRLKLKMITLAVLSSALWVVPSFGTQGMGTIRQGYRHPDRTLAEVGLATSDAQSLLEHADRRVTDAVLN